MSAKDWKDRIARLVLPWPLRHERKEKIKAAESERTRSERSRSDAERLGRQLEELVYDHNHIADAIAWEILRGRRK